ncbi:MAG: coproporphyrinogen III oxidase [Methylocystaceae bacterium]|nr:coproporphyrinogen III oxidase [Methylocystaceae bacterium]
MSYAASRPFGLYVHWPFCVSKCPYCDFNSHVAQSVDHDHWAQAFVAELKRVHQQAPERTLSSIFFGGGTPSLMAARTVQTVIDEAQKLWGFTPDIEITLEANPTTVEINTFKDLRLAGVNRLSIGIQSLRPDVLKFLGRAHSIEEAHNALTLAQKSFDRYSFDLIYARPGQTLEDWRVELGEALDLSAGHLSLYQLTIEPGTKFYHDGIQAVDEELGADLFDLTQDMMEAARMPAYEISNHAKLGQESRHNLIYWQGDDYIGIGPGAHNRLNNYAIHQIYKPDLWLNAIDAKGSGEQKRKKLDPDERIIELLLMGLRLRSGIDKAHFQHLTGQSLLDCIDQDGFSQLLEADFICDSKDTLSVTPQGRKCLDAVLEKLVL